MFTVIMYISAICSANLIVAKFGPAVTPINDFLLIGLDMAIRDSKHEQWKGNNLALKMFLMIYTAGAASYIVNPASGLIAVASLAAFCLSSVVDSMTYQAMMRSPRLIKSNGSNIAGAAVDSVVFPMIAFSSFMPIIVLSQFAAKVAGGFIFSALLLHVMKGNGKNNA